MKKGKQTIASVCNEMYKSWNERDELYFILTPLEERMRDYIKRFRKWKKRHNGSIDGTFVSEKNNTP